MVIFFRKGLNSVVATSLLLVITIVAVVGFQSWFRGFSNSIFVDVENGLEEDIYNTNIETLVGNNLYIKFGSNTTVFNVEIDGVDCNINGNFQGFKDFDISNCLNQVSGSTHEVLLLTNKGVLSEIVYVDETDYNSGPNSNDPEGDNFYLAENGVTVVCDLASVGDTGIVNGITYTKRSKTMIDATNALTTCTSGVTDMSHLFYNVDIFNQDIGSWDVSKVTNMYYMFNNADGFNQDISKWNVSSVTNMEGMFAENKAFNKDISSWDVSGVMNMQEMFMESTVFNQDLSSWNVDGVSACEDFSTDASAWILSKPTFTSC